jgi:large subunit ribosomal protein L21
MYAVVESGGKQYKVVPGQIVDVEKLDVAEGATVNLEKVLLIGDDNEVMVGKPAIEGARVTATSKGNGKCKKVIVFKYKPKVRYTRKTGHRQAYTRLRIDKIVNDNKD